LRKKREGGEEAQSQRKEQSPVKLLSSSQLPTCEVLDRRTT
jgi:hypothetical protein